MMVKFDKLILKNIDVKDDKQVDFYNNTLTQNKYLDKGNINIDDVYLVYSNEDVIGFLSLSSLAITGTGLNQIKLCYGIGDKYKNRNYEEELVNSVSDFLLKDDSNLLIFNISREDEVGQEVLLKCGYVLEYTDDDNLVYTKYADKLDKKL